MGPWFEPPIASNGAQNLRLHLLARHLQSHGEVWPEIDRRESRENAGAY
jgi:hypothetical protein